MSEMIERVARAMRDAYSEHEYGAPPIEWERAAEDAREAWLVCARAAIKAMREPDKAMAEALGAAIQKPGREPGVVSCDPGLVAYAWYRMIDAALAEPQK